MPFVDTIPKGQKPVAPKKKTVEQPRWVPPKTPPKAKTVAAPGVTPSVAQRQAGGRAPVAPMTPQVTPPQAMPPGGMPKVGWGWGTGGPPAAQGWQMPSYPQMPTYPKFPAYAQTGVETWGNVPYGVAEGIPQTQPMGAPPAAPPIATPADISTFLQGIDTAILESPQNPLTQGFIPPQGYEWAWEKQAYQTEPYTYINKETGFEETIGGGWQGMWRLSQSETGAMNEYQKAQFAQTARQDILNMYQQAADQGNWELAKRLEYDIGLAEMTQDYDLSVAERDDAWQRLQIEMQQTQAQMRQSQMQWIGQMQMQAQELASLDAYRQSQVAQWGVEEERRRQELLAEMQTSPRKWITYEMLARGQMPEAPAWLANITQFQAGQQLPGTAPTQMPTPPSAQTFNQWTPSQQQQFVGYLEYMGMNPNDYYAYLNKLWPTGQWQGQAQWQ